MRFDSVKKLKGEAFRRLTGVQRSTFEDMVGLPYIRHAWPVLGSPRPVDRKI
jgi:hypothetical protein